MLKHFNRQPAEDDHESLFMGCYEQLLRQATELTGDEAQAEDLLHDAFINFTLRRPALDRLYNVEGYLYRMIRNLFVSEARRRAQMQTVSLTPGDYETAQLGLRALPRNDQTRAELLSICHYACLRKESAIAASALILRFFHSYSLQEVATLLRAPKQQIYDWLKLARREARLFGADPTRLKFLSGESAINFPAPAALNPDEDVIEQLRALILQARQGECFTAAEWRQLYSPEKRWALETPFAAHLASCASCLHIVSEAHRMPTPDERDPTAMSGPDDRPAPPRRKHPKSGGERLRVCQKRRAETFNHRPSELHIAVNGFALLSQIVAGVANEQTMRVNIDEAISFVEVFSEQGVRLLLLEIEPPADGALEQHESLALSDGRRLSVTLTCDRAWPQLHVAYFDPTLEDWGLRIADCGLEDTGSSPPQFLLENTSHSLGFLEQLKSAIRFKKIWPQSAIKWLLRPVTITVLLAIVLLTVVVGQKLGWWLAAPAKLEPREIRPGKIAPEHTPTSLPKAETNTGKTAASPPPTVSGSVVPSAVSAVASTALEIELLRLLRDARADLNEQIEVNRMPIGKLRVEGILETDQRKAELLAALAPIKDHPAVEIHLLTVAEAVQRQRAQSRAATSEPIIEQTEITAAALPVEADLRRHFAARGIDDARMEAAIRGFAATTIANAHRVRSHATTLKRLAGRFSGAQLEQLDPQARESWRDLLRHHARGLLDETLALRAALAPIFGADSRDESTAPFDLKTNEGLRRACDQLVALCLETDRAIGAAFTLSARSASNAENAASALRTAGFHTRLHRIEHLAAAISRWE